MQPDHEFGPVRIYAGEKNGKYPDGNQVIVAGSHSRAAFDSPLVAHRIGADFDTVDLVIQGHVHEDHIAGLPRIPAHIPVWVHEGDLHALQSWEGMCDSYGYGTEIASAMRPYIEREFNYRPRPQARAYRDGARWDLGDVSVQAIHTPGHTPGHCVLLVEPVGVAFIGDIDLSGFGPYYGDASSSLAQFRASLELLQTLPATVWVTSHHRGVYSDREHFLEDLAAFGDKLQQREQKLLGMLQAGPRTLDELVAEGILYKPEAEVMWRDFAEAHSIRQHLQELCADGRVQASKDRFTLAR